MLAVVLVGGLGTRMRPLTYSAPKQMLPIGGVAMLEHLLSRLASHGVDRAVLSLGYLPDPFIDAYPDRRAAGVELSFAIEPEPMDTAGAIRFATNGNEPDGTFVVVNGDVITDCDLTALIALHRERGAQGTIALKEVEDPSRFGVVVTDADDRVEAFIEKPSRESAPSRNINAGTYVLEPSFLDRVELGRPTSIERETFPAMSADGVLFATSCEGYWLDSGTPEAYLRANLDVIDGILVTAGTSSPVDGSIRDASARIEGTIGHSVISADCIIERGAVVRDSVVLAGAHIGPDVRIEDSIIGAGARIGAGSHLSEHSVVGFDASIPECTESRGERHPQ